MWALLLLTLTVLLFLLPLIPALHELQQKHDAQPLSIIPTYKGNIRQFEQSFREFIEREIGLQASGHATADFDARYSLIGMNGLFQPSQEEEQNRMTHRVIVSEGPLALPDNYAFLGEVYGRHSIQSGIHNQLRGLLAENELVIQRDSAVLRWAHARNVRVGQNCHIFGRLSAEEELILETGCRFTRLNAKSVRFGSDSMAPMAREAVTKITLIPAAPNIPDGGRWLTDSDMTLPENCLFHGDIMVCGELSIGRGCKIIGSVKGHGNVRLEPDVSISGALVSGKSLVIGRDCKIGGPIIAEKELDIDTGSVIGEEARPTTVTAPVIRVAMAVQAYGTVWAREAGTFVPSTQTADPNVI
jgi:predicted acyltransferase (DUF342 family)